MTRYKLLKKLNRLNRKVVKSKKRTRHTNAYKELRKKVIERDGSVCRKCGSFLNLEVHHVIYRSQGGADTMDNLITLCCYCHLNEHKNEPVSNIMRYALRKKGLLG